MTSTPPPIRLGVNIDHVATLRNARGGMHPDPLDAARYAIQAGADGITLHVREDRRHVRDDDLRRIRAALTAPINFEMAATPEMRDLALATRPHACCLVPEHRAEITTEGGLNVVGGRDHLRPVIAALGTAGIRVSLFIDPDPAQLAMAAALGAPVVELHTGAYAHGRPNELARLRDAAAQTRMLGLECHAGHGLTYDNVGDVAAIDGIAELNIGHFLIGQAVFEGLDSAIDTMRRHIAAGQARR